jgi:hypothetical protein
VPSAVAAGFASGSTRRAIHHDRALRQQGIDGGCIEAVFCEQCTGVLPEAGRRTVGLARRARQFDGDAYGALALDLDDHFAVQGVCVGEHLGDRAHRAGRNARGQQIAAQLLAIDLLQMAFEQGAQLRAMAKALGVGDEARVFGQFRVAEKFAELFPLPVVAYAEEHLAGPGREFVVGHDVGVGIAAELRRLARFEPVGALRVQQCHGAVVERGFDELAATRALAFDHGEQNADDGGKPRGHVHHGYADAQWAGFGGAVDAHEAAQRLRHGVVARRTAERAVGAEAAHAAMDEARKALAQQLFITHAPTLERADLEVFDQHVAVFQHVRTISRPVGWDRSITMSRLLRLSPLK